MYENITEEASLDLKSAECKDDTGQNLEKDTEKKSSYIRGIIIHWRKSLCGKRPNIRNNNINNNNNNNFFRTAIYLL